MWIMKINTNTEVVRQFFCKLIIIKKLFLPIGLYERETYYRGMVMGLPLSCCFSLHVNRHLNIVLLSACLFKALLHKSPVCSDWSAHTSLNRRTACCFFHICSAGLFATMPVLGSWLRRLYTFDITTLRMSWWLVSVQEIQFMNMGHDFSIKWVFTHFRSSYIAPSPTLWSKRHDISLPTIWDL